MWILHMLISTTTSKSIFQIAKNYFLPQWILQLKKQNGLREILNFCFVIRCFILTFTSNFCCDVWRNYDIYVNQERMFLLDILTYYCRLLHALSTEYRDQL